MLFESANEIETNAIKNTIDAMPTDCMQNTVVNIWLAQLK